MVVKRRLLIAIATAFAMTATAAAPMAAAFTESAPKPLRKDNLLRVKDIASNGTDKSGPIVSVVWRQATNPARVFVAFSTNGGKDYLRSNGRLRKYAVLGDGRLGASTDICNGQVWVATAFRNTGDKAGDSDLLLTTRKVGGGADQRFMTDPGKDRKVRDPQVVCLNKDRIAVAWLEQRGGATRARLLIRSTEPLSKKNPAVQEVVSLEEEARYKDGIAVAGTKDAVHVAWVKEGNQNMRIARVPVNDGTPDMASRTVDTIAFKDTRWPQLAAHSDNVVLGYTDGGKVKVKLSNDIGQTWSSGRQLISAGSIANPSVSYSVDIYGNQVVVEVSANKQGKLTPKRIRSSNLGTGWGTRDFGHKGARVGTLMKKKGKAPLLREAWHNNASTDTLRAQYEKP